MFAEILTLKGPAPQVVFGVIKPRRRAKVVPKAWQLQVELNGIPLRTAVDMDNYAGYEAMEELIQLVDSLWDDYKDDYDWGDYYDYRELEVGDAEDYIAPRLRVKVNGRATDGVNRWRFRRRDVRCWKSLRDSQYHSA